MQLIKSAKGFSLPELIVSLAVLAGISIVTMKVVEDQMGNEAFLKGSADISKAVSNIEMVLNNPESCRYTLKERSAPGAIPVGLSLPPNSQAPISGFKTHVSRLNAERVLLLPNSNYGTFRTSNFIIEWASASSANVVLNFSIKKKSIKIWRSANDTSNDLRIVKRIPILMQTNTSNQITDCGPVISSANGTAKEKFCRSLGSIASWNDTTKVCSYVPQVCPYGTVPERLTNLAIPNPTDCVPIENQIDLSYVFSQASCTNTGNGYTVIREGSGSLRIQCL